MAETEVDLAHIVEGLNSLFGGREGEAQFVKIGIFTAPKVRIVDVFGHLDGDCFALVDAHNRKIAACHRFAVFVDKLCQKIRVVELDPVCAIHVCVDEKFRL